MDNEAWWATHKELDMAEQLYTHSHNEQNKGNILTNVLGKLRGRVDSRHDRNEELKPYRQPLPSLSPYSSVLILFIQHLLSTYYVPDTVNSAGGTTVNKTHIDLCLLWGLLSSLLTLSCGKLSDNGIKNDPQKLQVYRLLEITQG